jgi:hypothetical protein
VTTWSSISWADHMWAAGIRLGTRGAAEKLLVLSDGGEQRVVDDG